MKIVFVAIATESLSIQFLSSFLKKHGHHVEVVFDPRLFSTEAFMSRKLAEIFDVSKEIINCVNKKEPDVIGFSVFTFNYQYSLALAQAFKKSGQKAPIVFGGVHPISVPELVISQDCVDIVCTGEGEYALLELIESIKDKKPRTDIKNLWFKENGKIIKNPYRPLIDDLDSLPFPDKQLFYDIYPGFIKDDYYTASSRGCPFACTYCANNIFHKAYKGLGRHVRRRSPNNIVDELVWAKEKFKIKQITFVDDVFAQDISWLGAFAQEYKKRVNLPYVMITHPLFMSEGIIKLLVASGCYFLLFGIQSVSEDIRRKVLKRFESNNQIKDAAHMCRNAGLKFSIDHIFNIPGEDIRHHEEALSFYNDIRPSIINSYWLQYFPGTEIIETAVKSGVIKPQDVERINNGLTSTSLVVGLGNRDSINPDMVYANFQFLFMLLPVMPRWFINLIIKHKWHLFPFKPSLVFNIAIKFLINLIQKRGSVYFGIIKSTLYFVKKSRKFKHEYGFQSS